MTVTYTAKVATSSFGCFLKLLLRWRGSVYKLLWREFLMFVLLYYILNFLYRFALNAWQKESFEMVVRYCEAYSSLIPVAFVLGFYVSIVVSRWWEQFNKIPWPDRMALFITAGVQGHDERGRLMRRTIMRYLCLSYVITLSSISPPVKKRFPTFQHMTEAGFMLANEQKIMEDVQTPHNKYFIPLVWSTSLVTRARKEGRIKDDFAVKTVVDELNEFRGQLGGLFNYDWISVPLVYTQVGTPRPWSRLMVMFNTLVVTLAVYSFFMSCLMGRQFIERPGNQSFDVYIPIFTFLQFFFYMGWLKVAETLVNPFGEDDDDFDINQVIDRNLQVSYLIVDEMHAEHPDLIKDAYWDEVDFELPYTAAAEHFRPSSPFIGSAMDINVTEKQAEFVVPGLGSIQENLSGEEPTNVVTRPASPTDIPPRRFGLNLRSPFPSKQHFLPNFLKRSVSRDSRNTDADSALGGSQRIKRQESLTSKGSESRPASPTITTVQDEIFDMSDLSDVEEDELNVGSAKSQMSDFWERIRLKQTRNRLEVDQEQGLVSLREPMLRTKVETTGHTKNTKDSEQSQGSNDLSDSHRSTVSRGERYDSHRGTGSRERLHSQQDQERLAVIKSLGDDSNSVDISPQTKDSPKPGSRASQATDIVPRRLSHQIMLPDSSVDLSALPTPSPDLTNKPLMQQVSQDNVDGGAPEKKHSFFERRKLEKILKGKKKGKLLPRSASMGEGGCAPGTPSGSLAAAKSHSNPGGNVKA